MFQFNQSDVQGTKRLRSPSSEFTNDDLYGHTDKVYFDPILHFSPASISNESSLTEQATATTAATTAVQPPISWTYRAMGMYDFANQHDNGKCFCCHRSNGAAVKSKPDGEQATMQMRVNESNNENGTEMEKMEH